ncbi:hypothetical protein OESDEN_05498 [Oesophagostomum dentatum]|uniref:Uncharacterized protein n=1 Tax=Oesophagostomum dentatum TaxID=61180 RepID=A0A0B1TGQ0_OESDE|nr:hypothetical protein OESDEN_05498 [Oesophagostomum dentatum]
MHDSVIRYLRCYQKLFALGLAYHFRYQREPKQTDQ